MPVTFTSTAIKRYKRFRRRTTKRVRRFRARKRFQRAMSKPLRSVRLGKGFPDKMIINHKLTYTARINAIQDGLGTAIVLKANSMHAPVNVAGVPQNQAPLLKDQMEPIYNHYVVIGSKVKFRVFYDNNVAGSTNGDNSVIPKGPVEWVVLRNDSTSTSPVGTMRAIREQNGVQHRVLPGAHVFSADQFSSAKMSYSAKRVFGKNPLANSRLQCAGPLGDPTEGYYYLFYARNIGENAVPIVVFIDVEYSAIWYERADVPSSTDTV